MTPVLATVECSTKIEPLVEESQSKVNKPPPGGKGRPRNAGRPGRTSAQSGKGGAKGEARQPSKRPPAKRPQHRSKSWDAIADWYSGWSGAEGSHYHKEVAIPALCDLLEPRPGERIIDIGCGAGALEPAIRRAGARYTGVDLSQKLITLAKKHHKGSDFHVGDATRLADVPSIPAHAFDGACFLLSLQDINPLEDAIASAASVLKPGGRLVAIMLHPCFRVPRQSGWGWDDGRQLRYRRVDRYLSPLDVPMKEYGGAKKGVTRSYHRALQDYFGALADAGFVVEGMRELPAPLPPKTVDERRPDRLAREEIPMFLGLRARLRTETS